MARLVRPPLVKLLKAIPQEGLDEVLSDVQLSTIADEVLEWKVKAVGLGLTEGEIENICEDNKNSNQLQKISMMKKWRAKNGDRATLRNLIVTSNKFGWRKFIFRVGKKLYPSQVISENYQGSANYCIMGLILCIFIGLIVSLLIWIVPSYWHSSPPAAMSSLSQSLPNLNSNFVNRESEVNELLNFLEFKGKKPRIISITGPPGFGKSTLAVYVGYKLLSPSIDISYIDMSEISGMKEFAETIITISSNTVSGTKYTLQDLYKWSKSLTKPTLVILDNCDHLIHSSQDNLQHAITKLLQKSSYKHLKMLTTSRQQVMYIENHRLLAISEFSISHSCDVLAGITERKLDHEACHDLANLTGGVPLALHVVGQLLNMPDSPKPPQIVDQLEKNLIGTLSPLELRTQDRVNVSIFLSYQYLDEIEKKVGRYLSVFPGSFDVDAASGVLKHLVSDVTSTLRLFVRRSLLDYNAHTERYVYHKLIREFFKNISSIDENKKARIYFIEYFTVLIDDMAHKEFIEAVKKFYDERHNFNHFFDQLSINTSLSESAFRTFMKVANTLSSQNHVFNYGLTSSELQSQIENVLLLLKQSSQNFIKYSSKKQFVETYSKLVILLMKTRKDVTVSKIRDQYEWLFKKYRGIIPTQTYSNYFSILAGYYEKNDDEKMAKYCHMKILQRKNALGEHHSIYGNLKLAKAFHSIADTEKSIHYCNKELDSITTLPLQDFVEVIDAVETLTELYEIYKVSDQYNSMGQVTMKLAEITENYIMDANPSQILQHIDKIISLITVLNEEKFSKLQKLENHLKVCIETSEGHHSSLNITLHHLFLEKKLYQMVILIGTSFLTLLENTKQDQILIPTILYFVGQSHFLSNNFDLSVHYYRTVVEFPGPINHQKYHSCSQLMLMLSSTSCFVLIPKLLLFHLGTVWNNLGNYITYSYPQELNISKSHSVSSSYSDFLSFEVSATHTTAVVPSDKNSPHQRDDLDALIPHTVLSWPALHIIYPIYKILELGGTFFLIFFIWCNGLRAYYYFISESSYSFANALQLITLLLFDVLLITLTLIILNNVYYIIASKNTITFMLLLPLFWFLCIKGLHFIHEHHRELEIQVFPPDYVV